MLPTVRTPSADLAGPLPTRTTKWARHFFPWQFLRFLWINLRMVRMISLSHGKVLPPKPPG